jgi:hypothetical protein
MLDGMVCVDNRGNSNVELPSSAEFTSEKRPDLLGGMVVVRTTAADGFNRAGGSILYDGQPRQIQPRRMGAPNVSSSHVQIGGSRLVSRGPVT